MQCFDTFRGFLHKLYAAIMDGKGREGTYNFFLTTTGEAAGRGAGHKAQGLCLMPCPPPDRGQLSLTLAIPLAPLMNNLYSLRPRCHNVSKHAANGDSRNFSENNIFQLHVY